MRKVFKAPFFTLLFVVGGSTYMNTAYAAGMSISSDAFQDGGTIPRRYAGPDACGGDNTSLPVSWHDLPATTESVVVTLTDPNGPKGMSVVHWIRYNIQPRPAQLLPDGDAASGTTGQNMTGRAEYRGPCPPVGDTPHHYVLTVTATDLPPGALPPGLSYSSLMERIAGHTITGSSIVGRYGR